MISTLFDHSPMFFVKPRNISLWKELSKWIVQHVVQKRFPSSVVDLVPQGVPILDITLLGCAHPERLTEN